MPTELPDSSKVFRNDVAKRIATALETIAQGSGGSAKIEEMTQAEYDALTPAQKADGTLRAISDGETKIEDIDNVNITTSDDGKILGVSVSGSDISVGAVTADSVVNNASVTPLNTYPYSGITNYSTAYRYGHLLIINFDVTLSSAINSWVNCFNIGLNANVVSTIGVVSTDTNVSTYAQAYFDTDKILVRISSPQKVQYRGQIIVLIA